MGQKIHRKEIHVHTPSILHALHVVLVGAGLLWPIFYTLKLIKRHIQCMSLNQNCVCNSSPISAMWANEIQ
jgi:hypothetical protein